MTKQRKLAAILFADIEGYTALMQVDEDVASQKLHHFQDQLQSLIDEYRGQVVNFYGDGALCTFDLPIDAVRFASVLQKKFIDAKVPVRMGIHSGTVTIEGDKVFGDSVNIASRIESMGVAGSILLSRKVRDDVKNRQDIHLSQLGSFSFKNVQDPIQLFALTDDGLVVPGADALKAGATSSEVGGKWKTPAIILGVLLLFGLASQLNPTQQWISSLFDNGSGAHLNVEDLDKRVAVLVFENQTMSDDLEVFGKMASDWITKALMEMEDVDVISAANIREDVLLAGVGELSKQTGVDLAIQGRYYLQEDQLIIHANVTDTREGKVLYALDPVQGPKSQMMDLLNDITEEMTGYWAVRGKSRYARNPPKYGAYQNLLKVEHIFGQEKDAERIETLLREAYEIDSTFYAPLLKLLVHYGNDRGSQELKDSLIRYIDQKDPPFTKWEDLRFRAIKAGNSLGSNWLEAADLNEQLYSMDSSYGSANYNASRYYLGGNYPQKAVDLLEGFDQRFRDMETEWSWREARHAEAYFRLKQYDRVIQLAENYPFKKIFSSVAGLHLRALIKVGKIEQMKHEFQQYVRKGVINFGGTPASKYELLEPICLEVLLNNDTVQLGSYVEMFGQMNKADVPEGDYFYFKGLAAFCRGDMKESLRHWRQEKRNPNSSYRFIDHLSRLGFLHAKFENTVLAHQIIEKLANVPVHNVFRGFNIYGQARIFMALNQKNKALQTLQHAIENGMAFLPYGIWESDIFLMPLFDDPSFQEMVRPKG